MILFGHPSGNPNAHHAALAHYAAGRLEAFCTPWMPTPRQLAVLRAVPGLRPLVERVERRSFPPLLDAPRIEGPVAEWTRMLGRLAGGGADEKFAYQANDWLMHAMRRACRRASVTAVHAYEDCSLWQFEEAARLGKACIYDMPIGYYPAWVRTQESLARQFADWLPDGGLGASPYVRPDQKRREMELANLVIAPSPFVRDSILALIDKPVAVAPYGVDSTLWSIADERVPTERLTFLFAGQSSVRKGVPLLLEAWKAADLKAARLELVGSWQLAKARQKQLPRGVTLVGPVSREQLRRRYAGADILVLPTYFEGRALVVGEALACGLPVITTAASGATDLVNDRCGRIVSAGSVDELVEALRFFDWHRDRLPAMRTAAIESARASTWELYRRRVDEAVGQIVGAPKPPLRDVAYA